MKIIEKGTVQRIDEHHQECYKCKTKFTWTGGDVYREVNYYAVRCPVCKAANDIDPWYSTPLFGCAIFALIVIGLIVWAILK